MTPGAITAGAVSAADTPAFGFNLRPAKASRRRAPGRSCCLPTTAPRCLRLTSSVRLRSPAWTTSPRRFRRAQRFLRHLGRVGEPGRRRRADIVGQSRSHAGASRTDHGGDGAADGQFGRQRRRPGPGGCGRGRRDCRYPVVTVANIALSVGHNGRGLVAVHGYRPRRERRSPATVHRRDRQRSFRSQRRGAGQQSGNRRDGGAAVAADLPERAGNGGHGGGTRRGQRGGSGWANFIVTAPALVIQTDTGSYGSTSLAETSGHYFLYASERRRVPSLKYNGSPVTSGGGWTPIGAVQTATGYDVAWQLKGTNEFSVWAVDNNGNYVSDVIGEAAGNSLAVESIETHLQPGPQRRRHDRSEFDGDPDRRQFLRDDQPGPSLATNISLQRRHDRSRAEYNGAPVTTASSAAGRRSARCRPRPATMSPGSSGHQPIHGVGHRQQRQLRLPKSSARSPGNSFAAGIARDDLQPGPQRRRHDRSEVDADTKRRQCLRDDQPQPGRQQYALGNGTSSVVLSYGGVTGHERRRLDADRRGADARPATMSPGSSRAPTSSRSGH